MEGKCFICPTYIDILKENMTKQFLTLQINISNAVPPVSHFKKSACHSVTACKFFFKLKLYYLPLLLFHCFTKSFSVTVKQLCFVP